MKMSKVKTFLGVTICLGVLLALLYAVVCGPSEMTMSQARKLFARVGGANKINQEAGILFARFGTRETRFLSASELKDFPAISTLGNSVVLLGYSPDTAAEIQIRFGADQRAGFIDIFPPNLDVNRATNFLNVSAYLDGSRNLRVAGNIFVTK